MEEGVDVCGSLEREVMYLKHGSSGEVF